MSPTQTAELTDGAALARRIGEETAARAAELTRRTGVAPCLATVLVGEDPASVTYVRMKRARCAKAGIASRYVGLSAATTTAELVDAITALSRDPQVHGILLQHPAGPRIDERAAFDAIAPDKDVDGVTAHSFAAMGRAARLRVVHPGRHHAAARRVQGRTPGQARGRGGPQRDPWQASRDSCSAGTRRCPIATHGPPTCPPSSGKQTSWWLAAVGRSRLIRGQDIKPGAVVIDAGYNPGNVGDVDFDTARTRARLITPVPGGVGPMTIAVLLAQTVDAATHQLGA